MLCIIITLFIQSQIAIAAGLAANNSNSADLKRIGSLIGEDFYIAAGEIPGSLEVLNFNITSINSPNLFYLDLETGQPHYIIDHDDESMNITRLLIDDDHFYLSKRGILTLPEGFAIKVQEFNPPEFMLYKNGKRIGNIISRDGITYEFRSDLNRSGGTDNWIVRFNVKPLEYPDLKIYSLQFVSPDILNFDMTSINNLDRLLYTLTTGSRFESLNFSISGNQIIPATSFVYTTSMCYSDTGMPVIAWLGQPYYVIDHSDKCVNITKILLDESEDGTFLLMDNETRALPGGFAITLQEVLSDCSGGRFLISQHGEEKDNRIIREGEMYEYRMDLNESGQTDNWVLRFNVDTAFAGMNNLIKINSTQLLSTDVLRINNRDKISFSLKGSRILWDGQPYYVIDNNATSLNISRLLVDEDMNYIYSLKKGNTLRINNSYPVSFVFNGYRTYIDNNGYSIRVIRDEQAGDINLSRDSTVYFMNNWFNVKINEDRDAAAVLSTMITSTSDELIGDFKYLYSDYVDFNLTSIDNPAILYYDLHNEQGHETLNLRIDNHYDLLNIDDRCRITAASFVYTTRIYPVRKTDELKIAWLGEPYNVIEHNSSAVLINKFLVNEHKADCYLLSGGDTLILPDGFDLTVIKTNTSIGTVRFSITQNHIEVDNTTIRAGEIYQYKTDLNNSGKDDNWVLRFNVGSIHIKNNTGHVRINTMQMISRKVLRINNGNVDILEDYRIDIKDEGNIIEVRMNDLNNDISLGKDGITDILNGTFHIREYNDGNVAALVKVINANDISQDDLNSRICFKDPNVLDIIDLPQYMETSTIDNSSDVNGSPGFIIFAGISGLLIAVLILRNLI